MSDVYFCHKFFSPNFRMVFLPATSNKRHTHIQTHNYITFMALWIQFKISKIFIKIPRVCSKLDFRTCHKIKLEFNQNQIGINTHTHTQKKPFRTF